MNVRTSKGRARTDVCVVLGKAVYFMHECIIMPPYEIDFRSARICYILNANMSHHSDKQTVSASYISYQTPDIIQMTLIPDHGYAGS